MGGFNILVFYLLGFGVCFGFDFVQVLDNALELDLGAEFRNGNCYRDLMDYKMTLAGNGTAADKMWAMESKFKSLYRDS